MPFEESLLQFTSRRKNDADAENCTAIGALKSLPAPCRSSFAVAAVARDVETELVRQHPLGACVSAQHAAQQM
ncbi:MAG TPA: hypothetical protein VMV10_10715 [Pirellulales bacterium]|nr:hypothetical protein [Pirellulales bacterium]